MQNNYSVEMVPIGKVKPDPRQPRRNLRSDDVDSIAQSIKSTGLLKNIEVDKNFVIVTGELRWRSAKQAGLKEIPVRIVDVTPAERKIRQLHENVHHYAMSPIETAEAIRAAFPSAHLAAGTKDGSSWTSVARRLGKGSAWVREHIALLSMPAPIKQAIDKRELPMDTIGSLGRVAALEKAGEVKRGTADAFKKKIVRGDIKTKDSVRAVSSAIADNPGAAMDYLKQTFKGKDLPTVITTLERVMPTVAGQKLLYRDTAKNIGLHARALTKILNRIPFENYGDQAEIGYALHDLTELSTVMAKWHKDLA